MERKAREVRRSPPGATFSYAQIETALAKIYEAEDVQRTRFRARLKHFRKLGIPSRNPGKGSRITYSAASAASDVFQLLICLELAEFGIDPYLIVRIVQRDWAREGPIWEAIDRTQRFPGDDFHVAIRARFMSSSWSGGWKQSAKGISVSSRSDPISIHIFKRTDSAVFLKELQEARQRFSVFNLSARVRAVEQALAEE